MLDIVRPALGSLTAALEPSGAPATPRRWEMRLLAVLVIASAIVRFWGLGNVGLHAPDEDTVALPAVHLAQHGEPLFPSGMYYARAIVQTYLVAGSIRVFGNSEWAMRLPSAICGVVVVLLAFFVGRRFLQPVPNLGFVASVALLPELIMQSQNSRMYIFLVACIAAYLLCIFAWERTGRSVYLLGALALMLLGLQFQLLMIFTALLMLYPGFVRADPLKLALGGLAIVVSLVGLYQSRGWIDGFYPVANHLAVLRTLGVTVEPDSAATPWRPNLNWAVLGTGVLAAMAVAWLVARQVQGIWGRVTSGVLVSLGLVAQFLFNYHIAMVLLLAAVIIALRNGLRTRSSLWILGAVSGVVTVAHVVWLNAENIGSRGVILVAMMGKASIWSFLNYLPVSYGAMVIGAVGAGAALWRIARGHKIPEAWLFVLLGVWAPLFLIGCFDVAHEFRYMTPVLLPLLIAAFATGQWFAGSLGATATPGEPSRAQVVAAVLTCVLVVNPLAVASVVNPGYDLYPDHKGAAEFMKSLSLQPGDVVIAEDVITQTYYLGKVDYWLTDPEDASVFGRVVNGEVIDNYTDTRVIATGEQLMSLLRDEHRGDLYIVGSGENFVNGHRWQRGSVIDAIVAGLDVVYEGRDGLTKVWKVSALRGK